jgi:3-methyladenine DNA glycosylase AlkD
MNVVREVRAMRAALTAAGSAERARNEKAYLKSDLEFLGADMPTIRKASKALAARVQVDDDESLRRLVEALWATRVHELRAVAMLVLERRVAALGARDLRLLERLLRESRSWAYLDWICLKVLAPMLLRVRRLRQALPRWARDDDFWMRRAALLTLLPAVKRGEVPFSAFAVLAVPMLGEKEFFIRKAIGWVLRDTSKRRPELVAEFVREHGAAMSGLTRREATRRLPPKLRASLG